MTTRKGKHMAGTTVYPGGRNIDITSEHKEWTAFGVACVNGCDQAGVVVPGELLRLINAAASVTDDGCDNPQPENMDDLRAALRAVRGEAK